MESLPTRARFAVDFQALGIQPDMIPRMPPQLASVDDAVTSLIKLHNYQLSETSHLR